MFRFPIHRWRNQLNLEHAGPWVSLGIRTPDRTAPPNLTNRRCEARHTFFRCGRYFTVGHEWYVTVREGTDLGPYPNRDEATLGLVQFVAQACIASRKGVTSLDDCGDRDATELEQLVREVLTCWEQRHLLSENSAYVWIQRRLDALKRSPRRSADSAIRTRVLENLLGELDGGVQESTAAGPSRSATAAAAGSL